MRNLVGNIGSLEKLASLLATEDLILEHAAVPTASFDLKTRKVTLPMWRQMDKTLYHMLVLHEIGHALYTPFDEFKGSVDDNEPNLKDYINVVEDARIERKIKLKYPGSRRDFISGYDSLNDRDFFGCKMRDPNTLNLIDRINLFFKLGTRIEIDFSDEEQVFVSEAERTTTFKDVVALAKRIYEFAQEQSETAEPHPGNWDEGQDGDFEGENSEEGSEESSDKGNTSDSKSEDEGSNPSSPAKSKETDENSDEESPDNSKPIEHEGGYEYSELAAQTVSEFERNMSEQMVSHGAKPSVYYDIDLRELDYKKVVVGYKDLIEEFELDAKYQLDSGNIGKDIYTGDPEFLWNWFLKKNKNSVGYLVKEFEMKKAAEQYSRAKSDKTGKVDPNKLFNYKFSEDIFLRNTVMPGAKSHGLVMLVDLSGSMSEDLLGTMVQLVCLTMFCRRAGIPHRVYGFTDCWDHRSRIYHDINRVEKREEPKSQIDKEKVGFGARDRDFKLLEFFTEKMNNQDFTNIAKRAIHVGFTHSSYGYGHRCPEELAEQNIPPCYAIPLGGTPLNEGLAYMRNLIKDFRRETNSEIVNLVCLTDGGSNALDAGYYGIARDKETRIQGRFGQYSDQTEMLLKLLKKTCGVHTINFFVGPARPWSLYYENHEIQKKYRKEKMITTHGWLGFDDIHTIMGGKNLDKKEVTLDDAKKIQKGQLARTMIKMGGSRRASRVVLSKFIDRISA